MVPDVVVIIAKSPVPGAVKTRLQPTFSAAEAAALAAASIRDTLDTVAAVGPARTVLAWDGPPVRWLPPDVDVVPQRGSTLDERLENAFGDVYAAEGGDPTTVFLVGMDTPHLTPSDFDLRWGTGDAVLGPSVDGGFWAIGFRRYVPGSIRGVPMSTPDTGTAQLARLSERGLRVRLLPRKRDVDDPSDAAAVASAAPESRFGRLHRRLVSSPCPPSTLFDAALAGAPVQVWADDGRELAGCGVAAGLLDASAWGRLSGADEVVVSRCEGPVLDIGCGPGRFVEALSCAGIPAMGVDLSREAVRQARRRGVPALLRSVNDRIPAEGRWGTALLADGNIGIGGDPGALLARCRSVLRPGAIALVETSPDPGHDLRTSVTLHGPGGRRSHPVPWAVVGSRVLGQLAAAAGFVAVEDWQIGGRAFVMLRQAG